MLCMAAIFFGFMYCNRPSQEQLEAQPRRSRRADFRRHCP